jgi:hypothetical protein
VYRIDYFAAAARSFAADCSPEAAVPRPLLKEVAAPAKNALDFA